MRENILSPTSLGQQCPTAPSYKRKRGKLLAKYEQLFNAYQVTSNPTRGAEIHSYLRHTRERLERMTRNSAKRENISKPRAEQRRHSLPVPFDGKPKTIPMELLRGGLTNGLLLLPPIIPGEIQREVAFQEHVRKLIDTIHKILLEQSILSPPRELVASHDPLAGTLTFRGDAFHSPPRALPL